MKKVIRKVVVWGLIIVIGLPNIVLGEPVYKLVGVAIVAGMIWWDVVASKKESSKKKA